MLVWDPDWALMINGVLYGALIHRAMMLGDSG